MGPTVSQGTARFPAETRDEAGFCFTEPSPLHAPSLGIFMNSAQGQNSYCLKNGSNGKFYIICIISE